MLRTGSNSLPVLAASFSMKASSPFIHLFTHLHISNLERASWGAVVSLTHVALPWQSSGCLMGDGGEVSDDGGNGHGGGGSVMVVMMVVMAVMMVVKVMMVVMVVV